jgi:hypothetical protein
MSLSPCQSVAQAQLQLGSSPQCGVSATDPYGNDVSASLHVTVVLANPQPNGSVPYVPCSTSTADQGACLPSLYNLTYSGGEAIWKDGRWGMRVDFRPSEIGELDASPSLHKSGE